MNRNKSIDIFKTLLVVGMVLSHTIGLIGSDKGASFYFSTFINLISFSGFMFCYGYVVNMVYLKKDKKESRKRLFKNFFRTIVVFYMSAIAYIYFTDNNISFMSIIRILLLYSLPTLSEFLASFAVLNIVVIITFDFLNKIKHNKWVVLTILIISLISTFIPYSMVSINEIGIIIGSTKFFCFPILQYLGYFMLGVYFEEYKIKFNFKYLIVSIICSFIFMLYVFINNQIPSRFPPSIYWIIGGAFFVYGYYLFSIMIDNKISLSPVIYGIGQNSLYFLLASNILLFIFKNYFDITLGFGKSILLGFSIIIISYLIIYIVKKIFNKRVART